MFEAKVAVITGSARGLGRAMAELLAAGGADVIIGDLDAGDGRAAKPDVVA